MIWLAADGSEKDGLELWWLVSIDHLEQNSLVQYETFSFLIKLFEYH